MTNSREKFEAWFDEIENFATRGERLKEASFGYAMYQAFEQGRESMRDEASEVVGDMPSWEFTDKIVETILSIEP